MSGTQKHTLNGGAVLGILFNGSNAPVICNGGHSGAKVP